jgi:hypothetical protein
MGAFKTSKEISAEPDIYGAFPLLLPLDFKFVNNFEENLKYFETHYKVSASLSNIFRIDHQRGIARC